MLSQEQVKCLFNYNSETGALTNKSNGLESGYTHKGYRITKIKGKSYRNHRIVFLYHNGFIPKEVDHINRNKLDNRIENLRGCTKNQNEHNKGIYSNNTSGIKGITWHKGCKKWQPQIRVNGKPVYLGRFKDISEAKKVLDAKRKELHGEFANYG